MMHTLTSTDSQMNTTSNSILPRRIGLCFRAVCLASAIFATTLLTGCAEHLDVSHSGGLEGATSVEAKVTELFSKDLPEVPGKEGLMITVEYPPGCVDPIHRHNAHGFIYLLEGSIIMQVKGGKEVTLKAGDTFYEGPDDVHVVGRNASKTERAKFVVFWVKNKDAPFFIPQQ